MASPNKSLSAFAVSNRKPSAKKSANSVWANYKMALVNAPDLAQSLKNITNFITANWTRDNAVEYEANQIKRDDVSKRYKASNKELDRLETKKAQTEPRIARAKNHGKETKGGDIKWDAKDVWLVRVLLFGAVVAMCLGSANLYANLMGAELPVFIQSPWLAITLSLILPIGSLAIKFMIHFFRHDTSRRLFALCLYMLTASLVLIWSYLFAQSFASVTGGDINMEAFL